MSVRYKRRPWTTQPQEITPPSALARDLGICRLFNAGASSTSMVDSVTGIAYNPVTGASSITFEQNKFGKAIRGNGTAYWDFPLRSDQSSGNMTAVFAGRVNGANGIMLRDDTGSGGTIPLWRNSGFDARLGGTDYTAAGTFNTGVDYCIVMSSKPGGIEIWVDGALIVTSASAGVSGNATLWHFGKNGTSAEICDMSWSHFALFDRGINSDIARAYSLDPLLMYAPRRIWIPKSSSLPATGGGPLFGGPTRSQLIQGRLIA